MSKRISAFVCGVVEFREPFSRFYTNPYSKSAYALGRKIARTGAGAVCSLVSLLSVQRLIDTMNHRQNKKGRKL